MVAWGIVMTLMGIVQSYEGLLIARIFLGVTEAGYVFAKSLSSYRDGIPCDLLRVTG